MPATWNVETWNSTRQLTCGVEDIWVGTRFHLFHNDLFADNNEVTAVVVIEVMVVPIALWHSIFLVSRLMVGMAQSLGGLVVNYKEYDESNFALNAFFLV